jgi:hypothetical protein
MGSPPARAAALARAALVWTFRGVLALVILEGAASLLLLAVVVPALVRPPFAERLHTRYDAELGWVNIPGIHRPDMYGPGVGLTINGQGFRAARDFAPTVPPGKVRVVCSGDSFTFGYGVGDDATWCARLTAIDGRLETVNMGQGGYGADQAYLWYVRDGAPLVHQAHVFAFINEDFPRMRLTAFFGYGKPILRLRDGELATDNVPVPRAAYWAPWLTQNLDVLREFRSIQLALLGVRWLFPPRAVEFDEADLPAIVLRIMERLDEINRRKGSTLLLAYLPGRGDREPGPYDEWRRFLAREAARRGITFVDLVEELRAVPEDEVERLFIADGALTFPGAAGHYTAAGNEWVARRLAGAVPLLRGRP